MEASRIKRLTEELKSTSYSEEGYQLCLEIGRVRLDVFTSSPSTLKRMSEYFSHFLSSGPADASIYIRTIEFPDLWEDDDSEFTIEGGRAFQRDFAAELIDSNRAVAVMAPGLDDAFHNLLRWYLPPFLLKKSCFLMHAAGVACKEAGNYRGYVFFGQSGAGKSTTAGLISQTDPGAILLGDDGVIIGASEDGRLYLYSAPLGCGYSRAAPPPLIVPLQGLYALEQSSEHEIVDIEPSEAVAALLASAMSVRFGDSIEERFQLALCFSEAIKKLRFKKDAGFWSLVRHGTLGLVSTEGEQSHVS